MLMGKEQEFLILEHRHIEIWVILHVSCKFSNVTFGNKRPLILMVSLCNKLKTLYNLWLNGGVDMANNSKEEVKVYKLKKKQTLSKKDNMDDDKILYETFLNRKRLEKEKQK